MVHLPFFDPNNFLVLKTHQIWSRIFLKFKIFLSWTPRVYFWSWSELNDLSSWNLLYSKDLGNYSQRTNNSVTFRFLEEKMLLMYVKVATKTQLLEFSWNWNLWLKRLVFFLHMYTWPGIVYKLSHDIKMQIFWFKFYLLFQHHIFL